MTTRKAKATAKATATEYAEYAEYAKERNVEARAGDVSGSMLGEGEGCMRGWMWIVSVVAVAALSLLGGCRTPVGVSPSAQPEPARSSAGYAVGDGSAAVSGYAQGNERRRDQRNGGARDAAPGQFDYYLLTLSWSPEFCYSHPEKPECGTGARFVVHGLWPENNDGSYPEHCSDAPGPANPAQYSDLYPDQGLLAHEWETHGTCSGMGPEAYFSAMRRAVRAVHIPEPLADVSQPISLSPDQIVTGFVQANAGTSAEDYSIGCGRNFLTQVQVCVDKNLRAVACQGVHTCGAMVVKVTPPGASRQQSEEGESRRRRRDRGGY